MCAGGQLYSHYILTGDDYIHMNKKIFNDVMVTINSKDSIKNIWLEEQYDDNGRPIKYKIQKSIQYKNNKFPELNTSKIEEEIKN
jgi:hypothetical protein